MPSSPATDTAKARLPERRGVLRAEIGAENDELVDTPSRQPRNQVEDAGEQGEQRIRDAVRHGESDRDGAATDAGDRPAGSGRLRSARRAARRHRS